MDIVNWNRGLMLAAILISIGGMAVISARTVRDRFLAVGLIVQAIAIAFAVSGAYHGKNELAAIAIPLIGISALWCFWDRDALTTTAEESKPSVAVLRGENSTIHPSPSGPEVTPNEFPQSATDTASENTR